MSEYRTPHKPKTMLDVECWELTQSIKRPYIKLPFFLTVLRLSPLTKDSDTTDVFFRLMDNGLPLHFSDSGCCFGDEKIPKSNVKCALLRIDDALFETNHSENKLFADEVIKTESGNDVSLADILIGEQDVSNVFAQMGFESYPWAKAPRPSEEVEVCELPNQLVDKKLPQRYLSYFDAKTMLESHLRGCVSDEEFWMWCFFGKESGGIDAFASDGAEKIKVSSGGVTFPTHRNEFGHLETRLADLTRYLKHWLFLSDEIDRFRPEHRYVTGQQLLRRWTELLGEFEAECSGQLFSDTQLGCCSAIFIS